MIAAKAGNIIKVKTLLKNNHNLVFSKDDFGSMPLHFAALKGCLNVAALLLARHADANAAKTLARFMKLQPHGIHSFIAARLGWNRDTVRTSAEGTIA
jgi:ankyrin repeat protein